VWASENMDTKGPRETAPPVVHLSFLQNHRAWAFEELQPRIDEAPKGRE